MISPTGFLQYEHKLNPLKINITSLVLASLLYFESRKWLNMNDPHLSFWLDTLFTRSVRVFKKLQIQRNITTSRIKTAPFWGSQVASCSCTWFLPDLAKKITIPLQLSLMWNLYMETRTISMFLTHFWIQPLVVIKGIALACVLKKQHFDQCI